jgi:hypothetical protein
VCQGIQAALNLAVFQSKKVQRFRNVIRAGDLQAAVKVVNYRHHWLRLSLRFRERMINFAQLIQRRGPLAVRGGRIAEIWELGIRSADGAHSPALSEELLRIQRLTRQVPA